MQRAAMVFLLVAIGASARADDHSVGTTKVPDHIRRETLAIYKFVPTAKPASAPVPVWSVVPQPEADLGVPDAPGVVKMPAFTVRDTFNGEALHAVFQLQKSEAHTAMMMRKLGVGVHEAHSGHFGAAVVTVFYIPIYVAAGASW